MDSSGFLFMLQDREGGDEDETFRVILRLYAHEDCVHMVSRCRLNPDFTNLNGELRNDL